MHAQITVGTARAVAPLREELDKLDDWANGLFVVLAEALPLLMRGRPAVAAELAPRWAAVAGRFDALQASGQRRNQEGESLELLEARKMLYRLFAVADLWKVSAAKRQGERAMPRRRA